jgi:hypothetical protein
METQMQAASLLLNDEIRKVYNENFMPQMQFVDSVARLDALNSRCSWPRADLRKKLDDIGKHL